MKNHLLLFRASFISYILVIMASNYITARTWADIILFVFIACVIYQVIYILYLGRISGFSLGRNIARYFLYSLANISLFIIFHYVYSFMFGYSTHSITGVYGGTYYGFEAWKSMVFESILYVPIITVSFIYIVIYTIISDKMTNLK